MYRRLLLSVALPIALLVGFDWLLAAAIRSDWPHSVSVIGAGMIGFVFALSWTREQSKGTDSTDTTIRSAIAVAIVIQYLVLVSIVSFFWSNGDDAKLPAITQTFVSNFTYVVGVVIAFYFGSSAYAQVGKARAEGKANLEPATGTQP